VLANWAARALLYAIVPLDPAFPPFSYSSIAIFTVLGVGLGAFVFALIAKRFPHPSRTFRIVALAALVVSIVPNFSLMANPSAGPFPGGSATAYAVLIVFHLVAGAVAIILLPALVRPE
jgi:hypothetical protein